MFVLVLFIRYTLKIYFLNHRNNNLYLLKILIELKVYLNSIKKLPLVNIQKIGKTISEQLMVLLKNKSKYLYKNYWVSLSQWFFVLK